ncbi:MAG: NnrS family protein [Magnetococcales bacterium]|nr:NnrS family protein [Magnetococcales bacterium]
MDKRPQKIAIQPRLFSIEEPPKPKGPALLAYGFRPFFILACLWSMLAMGMWLMILYGPLNSTESLPSSWWHGHEMLFGFVAAAASGFLLTAVTNWTQSQPLRGIPLLSLALLWSAGRLLMWWTPPEAFFWLASVIDLSFLLALAGIITLPVVRTRMYHQGIFPALILLLWFANLLFHLEWLGITQETAVVGMRLGINSMVWLIVVFGGRMLPAFTQNAFANLDHKPQIRTWPLIETLAHGSLVAVCIGDILFLDYWATGLVFILTACIHAIRLAGWKPMQTIRHPIVWVLHLGYAWIVIGFLLRALAVLTDWMMPSTAFHAITVGGFGVLILGIMTRVTLAHTGRPLQLDITTSSLFLLMALNVPLRLGFVPFDYGWAVSLSGVVWVFVFLIYSLKFLPFLVRPRVDGRPG